MPSRTVSFSSSENSSKRYKNSVSFDDICLPTKRGGSWRRMIVRGNHATTSTMQTGGGTSTTAPSSILTTATSTAPTSGPVQTQQSLPSLSWQLSTNPSSPVRIRSMHGQNFSVDSATYREMLERRKSFRCRGSLVTSFLTVASLQRSLLYFDTETLFRVRIQLRNFVLYLECN